MAGDHSSQESADRGHWFVLKDGQELGPISTKELAGYLADGLVAGSDLVRRTGQNWMPADKIGQVDRELPSIKKQVRGTIEPTPAKPPTPLFASAQSLSGSPKTSAETSDGLAPGPATPAGNTAPLPKHSVLADALRVRDYALRHWHGELSLPVAGLVNGLLLAWPFALVTWLCFARLAQASVVPFGVAYVFAVVVPLAVLALWQIGLWRSADKFAAGGGDWRWAMLARAMVVVAIAAWAYDAWTREWMASESPTAAEPKIEQATFQPAKQAISPAGGEEASPRPHAQQTSIGPASRETRAKEVGTEKSHEAKAPVQNLEGAALVTRDHPAGDALHMHRHRTELELTGPIGPGIAAEFARMLDAAPQVKLVRLNSPGGDFSEAKLMGAEIKRRGLTTMVSQTCASACVIIFLNGRERLISRNGKLGFNVASPAGPAKDQVAAPQVGEKQALLDTGLPLGFIDKAMATTAPFVPSREELISAGIITGASDHELRPEHRFHHNRAATRHHRWTYRSLGRDD